jgi:hypothetical protein
MTPVVQTPKRAGQAQRPNPMTERRTNMTIETALSLIESNLILLDREGSTEHSVEAVRFVQSTITRALACATKQEMDAVLTGDINSF